MCVSFNYCTNMKLYTPPHVMHSITVKESCPGKKVYSSTHPKTE